MIAKFAMLERDKRRAARLRKLFDEQAKDGLTAESPEFLELAKTIRSLEAGMDAPVSSLEFRKLIRHD